MHYRQTRLNVRSNRLFMITMELCIIHRFQVLGQICIRNMYIVGYNLIHLPNYVSMYGLLIIR